MTDTPRTVADAPKYVTVSQLGGNWGVAELHHPDNGAWWVEVKRSGLPLHDAQDLRDAWNQRGDMKRE